MHRFSRSLLALGALSQIGVLSVGSAQAQSSDNDAKNESYTGARGPARTAVLKLPFSDRLSEVTFYEVDGAAIVEGDIILGGVNAAGDLVRQRVVEDSKAETVGGVGSTRQSVIGTAAEIYRWPDGIIPYDYASDLSRDMKTTIRNAAQRLTSDTNLIVRRRNSSDKHWVTFKYHNRDSGCFSQVGMNPLAHWNDNWVGAEQSISLLNTDGCSEGTVMHEILHTAGLWHEQSREDRNQYVDYFSENVRSGFSGNFKIHASDGIDVGAYDYASILHYGSGSFGKDAPGGGVLMTLLPKNPDGAYNRQGRRCIRSTIASPTNAEVMGQRACLSQTDINGVNALYPGPCEPGYQVTPVTDHRAGSDSDGVTYRCINVSNCPEGKVRVRITDHRPGQSSEPRFVCREPRRPPPARCPEGQSNVRVTDNRGGERTTRYVCRAQTTPPPSSECPAGQRRVRVTDHRDGRQGTRYVCRAN